MGTEVTHMALSACEAVVMAHMVTEATHMAKHTKNRCITRVRGRKKGVPASAGPSRTRVVERASWPAGLPRENQEGLASNPRRRGSISGGKTHVDQPSEEKEALTQAVKCKVATQPDSPQLFFGQVKPPARLLSQSK